MNPDAVLSLHKVVKFYGEKLIFRNLNFVGLPGRLYLILGTNGSGKSTLLRLMAGLSSPSGGNICYAKRRNIAYLAHATFIYPNLTALQNLRFWSSAYGINFAHKDLFINILERVGLDSYAHEKAKIFSRGMAQRLNFARCLLLEPNLMLLDEPYTGLDQQSQSLIANEIKNLRNSGTCIVQVSHSPQTDGVLADHIFEVAKANLNRVSP